MDLFDAFAASDLPHPPIEEEEPPPPEEEYYPEPALVPAPWEQSYPVSDAPDADSLVEGLNPQQKQAVQHHGSPLLIMAGAGSGKTRVLTHRIAYLLATGQATPGQILAITFTNKAAAEMRERVSALVGGTGRRIWVSTFHSACVRILREHYQAAGLKSTFSIYDAQDSLRLMTMVLRDLEIDTKRFTARFMAGRISDLKNELVTPDQFGQDAPEDPVSQIVVKAYRDYNRRLRQANALDFDDLIQVTVEMLANNPAVAEHYHRRFRHILVDEYQDTNHAQYMLVRALVGVGQHQGGVLPPAELTVVGDSDQSIYAFRGATIRNIEEFERDFPGATTILLEQNYRSTQNILAAANAVISRNRGRRAKKLWTATGDGALVTIDAGDSEYDEARLVVKEIDDLSTQGVGWSEIAIFYRTNSQSRALEELLLRSGIPYRLIGGTRFYERQEIKDALAYLQSIVNPDDTVALRRVINTPRRGIGARAEAALLSHADRYGLTFGEALAAAWGGDSAGGSPVTAPIDGLSPRAQKSVGEFWGLLVEMRALDGAGESPAHILDEVLARSGYLQQLQASEDPQDASRVDNLAELLSVAEDFHKHMLEVPSDEEEDVNNPTPQGSALAAFLERVALVADADQLPSEGEDSGQVTLMTVHTAKGLEFPYVFVTGMEDGTFPHKRSLDDEFELAEERRLAYVAITRARKKLYLMRANTRSAWGSSEEMIPSRFLDDLPAEVVDVQDHSNRSRGFGSGSSSNRAEGYRKWEADDDGGPIFGAGGGRSLQSSFTKQPSRPAGRRMLGGEPEEKPSISVKVGDRVQHGTLGEGTVVGTEGSGRQAVARIDFGGTTKRLLLRMAPIKKL